MINRDLPQSSVDKTSFFLSYGPDLVSDQSGKEGRGSARRAQKASRKVVRCWSDCKHLERSTSILRLCLKIAWILRVSTFFRFNNEILQNLQATNRSS